MKVMRDEKKIMKVEIQREQEYPKEGRLTRGDESKRRDMM